MLFNDTHSFLLNCNKIFQKFDGPEALQLNPISLEPRLARNCGIIAFKAIEDNEEPMVPEIFVISSSPRKGRGSFDFWNDEDDD